VITLTLPGGGDLERFVQIFVAVLLATENSVDAMADSIAGLRPDGRFRAVITVGDIAFYVTDVCDTLNGITARWCRCLARRNRDRARCSSRSTLAAYATLMSTRRG
jgi:hypothetical protein